MLYITLPAVRVCDTVFIKYNKLGKLKKKTCWDNKLMKCLWLFVSCILGFFLLILILLFYILCGAPYELIRCYIDKKCVEEDEEEMDIEYNRRVAVRQKDEKLTTGQIWICVLLGFCGVLLQPFYLLFYILYAIMECYRRLPCWVIYAAAY
jgi:hypothetical protein